METATETAAAADDPRQIVVRVPLEQCSLLEAKELVEDASFYDVTRMPILFHFPQVTVDGYWGLSVRDHAEMVVYLSEKGLI